MDKQSLIFNQATGEYIPLDYFKQDNYKFKKIIFYWQEKCFSSISMRCVKSINNKRDINN